MFSDKEWQANYQKGRVRCVDSGYRGCSSEHRRGVFVWHTYGKTATALIDVQREQLPNRELAARMSARPEGRAARASLRTLCYVLASTVCYYVATQIAWVLTFPDSKVSLFFPPQAVLLCILLLVPTRHWWAYVLTAASAHFLATQQAHWPPLYALPARCSTR